MPRQEIEKILARVSAVEANDSDAGAVIRQVVSRAELNWNTHPDNDNTITIVKKTLHAEDLAAAAEQIGLSQNVNVKTFIQWIAESPAPVEPEIDVNDDHARAEAEAQKIAEQDEADALMNLAKESFDKQQS